MSIYNVCAWVSGRQSYNKYVLPYGIEEVGFQAGFLNIQKIF